MKRSLKYIGCFIVTLVSLIMLQHLAISVPNKYIEKNMIETVNYYKEQTNYAGLLGENISSSYLKDSLIIDNYSDCLTLNMLWNTESMDNKWKNQIMMPYYENIYYGMGQNLNQTVIEKQEPNQEYSRYWHGSMIYLKPLLLFFNIKEIKIINCLILIILTIYLLKLISKKSKKMFITFILGLISIGIFVVPFCFEYYFAFLIMLISSIITMKILKKEDKYFYYLMIITGTTICFMDFLTCETLTLTIPLFLKLYFNRKKTTKENIIFIIKSSLCWGLSYALAFALKWIITALIMGPIAFIKTWQKAKIRIYDLPIPETSFTFVRILLKATNLILPISFFKSAPIITIILILLVIWIYIFCLNKKQKKKYNYLILISMIPILRLLVLYAHTFGHYFFDYRALLPLVIISIFIIYDGIKEELKKIKKR